MANMLACKSLDMIAAEASETGDHSLKRALGPVNLVALGIGAIIGAGIFVLTGQAAANYAGPAIVYSFILAGTACTLGELLAWIIGWDLILEYLFAASTVAVGWSGYVVSFLKDLGINIPPQYTGAVGSVLVNVPDLGWKPLTAAFAQTLAASGIQVDTLAHVTCVINLPAMFIVALLTTLLVIGIRESANFNNVMVITKVSVIILFIAIGFMFVKSANWHPFIPENKVEAAPMSQFGGLWGWLKAYSHEFGKFGISGVLRGAGVIFFAYIGFDAVSTAAQEAKNPQRDMPVGILGSLGISTVLYILVAIVLTGIVSYTTLNVADPVAVGVDAMGKGMFWLRPIVKIAAIAGLSSVILVMLMGQPRIFYSMSKDGLLPPVFSKVHPKFQTPYISTIITGSVAMIIAGVLPISILGELVSIGTLLAFIIVCISVLVLRKTRPDIERPFRTPWVPVIPILGAVICFAQMAALPLDTWLRLLLWLMLGFLIYFS